MNYRRALVLGVAAAALVGFGGAAYVFTAAKPQQAVVAPTAASPLVRAHSPVLGPANAPVTIVEFFDPACEACRAFHPIVKQIMNSFPGKVRVVLRYAAFHNGSDEAVRILETARLQGLFEPVLEALYAAQPAWADHAGPRLDRAWAAAASAGLNLERARRDQSMAAIAATLDQDSGDVIALGVRKTPTFFVNGKPLQQFGAQQLFDLVKSEAAAR